MTKKRRKEILDKIEWEGGYDSYFIYYGTDEKDMKKDSYYFALVRNYILAYEAIKKFLEEE